MKFKNFLYTCPSSNQNRNEYSLVSKQQQTLKTGKLIKTRSVFKKCKKFDSEYLEEHVHDHNVLFRNCFFCTRYYYLLYDLHLNNQECWRVRLFNILVMTVPLTLCNLKHFLFCHLKKKLIVSFKDVFTGM